MRRLWGLGILILVMLWVTAAAADFGMINQDDTLLRNGSNTGSAWTHRLPEKTWVELIGSEGSWLRVRLMDGSEGWVTANRVDTLQDNIGVIGLVDNIKDGSYLNLRESDSYQADVLGVYGPGAPCILYSQKDGWYRVEIDGKKGYFREEYIRRIRTAWSHETATLLDAQLLREGPGEQFQALQSLAAGTYAMVLNGGTDWARVNAAGTIGFVPTESLTKGLVRLRQNTSASPTAVPQQLGTAVVSGISPTQVLNLRALPDGNSKSVAQFGPGTTLTVLKQGLQWCKLVSERGQVGYARTDFLTLSGLPEIPTLMVTQTDHTYANLRADASLEATVLAQVPDGSAVTVLIPGDSWVLVEWENLTGYIAVYMLR